uniref:Ig-like domain-containing protein n=1 Tax=Callorhinchus milii TaxID=7868 RepID=A0A4W3GI67_CALMI
MRSLISLSLLLAVFSCKCYYSDIVSVPLSALRLTCRSSGFNYNRYYCMFWYRQLPGKQREKLLTSNGISSNSFESGVGNRVTVVRENSNNIFDLIIKSPRVEDTATYYCAADSQCEGTGLNFYKYSRGGKQPLPI